LVRAAGHGAGRRVPHSAKESKQHPSLCHPHIRRVPAAPRPGGWHHRLGMVLVWHWRQPREGQQCAVNQRYPPTGSARARITVSSSRGRARPPPRRQAGVGPIDSPHIHHHRPGPPGQNGPGGRRIESPRSRVEPGMHSRGRSLHPPGMRPCGVIPDGRRRSAVTVAGLRTSRHRHPPPAPRSTLWTRAPQTARIASCC